MVKYLHISSYFRKLSSNMTLQPIPFEFPYIEKKFVFFFINVGKAQREGRIREREGELAITAKQG
jgi:hypothetical protein